MTTIEDFYREGEAALVPADEFAGASSLANFSAADHMCYKCGSRKSFENMRALLEPESAFLYQSYIAGRRIAYMKLKRPFESKAGPIWFLELSDQKPDGSQQDGFDHIEVYPAGISYAELAKRTEATGRPVKKVERPHHTTYDIKLEGGFLIRLEEEPLLQKIKRKEM